MRAPPDAFVGLRYLAALVGPRVWRVSVDSVRRPRRDLRPIRTAPLLWRRCALRRETPLSARSLTLTSNVARPLDHRSRHRRTTEHPADHHEDRMDTDLFAIGLWPQRIHRIGSDQVIAAGTSQDSVGRSAGCLTRRPPTIASALRNVARASRQGMFDKVAVEGQIQGPRAATASNEIGRLRGGTERVARRGPGIAARRDSTTTSPHPARRTG